MLRVLRVCAKLRIHVVFIPAKMTYLLQPLDTHIFSSLKLEYPKKQAIARAPFGGWLLPDRWGWVAALEAAVQSKIVARQHDRASLSAGLTGDFGCLRSSISEVIGYDLPLPGRAPSVEELHTLLGQAKDPRFRDLAWSASMRSFERGRQPGPAHGPNVAPVARAVRLPRLVRAADVGFAIAEPASPGPHDGASPSGLVEAAPGPPHVSRSGTFY